MEKIHASPSIDHNIWRVYIGCAKVSCKHMTVIASLPSFPLARVTTQEVSMLDYFGSTDFATACSWSWNLDWSIEMPAAA